MDCKKVNKLLIRYLEGDLDELAKSSTEEHLKKCRKCLEEIDFLKQILKISKAEEIRLPSEEYWAGYLARLRRKIGEKSYQTWWDRAFQTPIAWRRTLQWAIPVFVLVLLLVLFLSPVYRKEILVPSVVKVPLTQTKPTRETFQPSPEVVAKIESERSTISSSTRTLIELADGIYEIYNPTIETTEVFDRIYAHAIDIENALEEKEKDYLTLIDELTNKEKEELIKKVKNLL